jgi:N-acetylglutamate synthase-like GNAT family acetyltransferase
MVSIRCAVPEDVLPLRSFLDTVGLFAGDGALSEHEPSQELLGCAEVRVAKDGDRVVGAYQLHVRNAGPPSPGELLFMAVEAAARKGGVDLLLIEDLVSRAAASGVETVQVLVRPPLDAVFRILGAVAIGIEPSSSGSGGPLIRLEMAHERAPGIDGST